MIFKLQQGGLPPLVDYTPVVLGGNTPSAPSVQSNNDTSGSKQDLTDKDVLSLLKDLSGLPNDSQALVSALQSFYMDQQFGMLDTSSIASRYLSILGQIQTANFNRKEYDNAFDVVKSNGGLNEVAVVGSHIVAVNKDGDFKYLTPEELKSQNEYQPITNSELLNFRAYSGDLAFNQGYSAIVRNGIGIQEVGKLINTEIGKIGEISKQDQGYVSVQQKKLISGIQDFTEAISKAQEYNGNLQDLYKYGFMTKTQAENAQYALSYIYDLLPENARTVLKMHSDDGTDNGAKRFIATMISAQLDSTSNFSISLEGGPTAEAVSRAKNSKDSSDIKSSDLLHIMTSTGGEDINVTIDRGDGVYMNVTGTFIPQATKPSGDPIKTSTMSDMLADSKLQRLNSNNRSITFGDQKVNEEQLKYIVYNNTGIVRANLPINPDGTVNIKIVEQYQDALQKIKNLGKDATQEQIAQIYRDNGLDELLLADGRINPDKFAPFAMIEGYTAKQFGFDNSDYIKEIPESDAIVNLLKTTLGTEIDEYAMLNPFDYDWVPFGQRNRFYKGVLYFPITNNKNAAIAGSNQHLDWNQSLQLEQQYQGFDKLNGYNPAIDADILNNNNK